MGHEGVGRIAGLGENVTSIDPSVQIGQRVGVAWTRDACGSCEFCTNLQNDGETRCAKAFHSGRVVDGTFAEYTLVPVRYLTRIPERFDDLSDEEVAPVLCGGVTAYKAIKCCGVVPGQWVAVSGGGGGVGAFAVAYARAMGYRVIALDAGKEKGEYSLAQGAEHYIDVTATDDAGEAVKQLTDGIGARAVIVAAGVGAAYRAAFSMLGPFGTLMCVGIPPPDHLVNFHPVFFVSKGWRVLGSAVGTRTDILEALEFVKRKLVTPKIQWGKFEDIASLLVDVAKGKVSVHILFCGYLTQAADRYILDTRKVRCETVEIDK